MDLSRYFDLSRAITPREMRAAEERIAGECEKDTTTTRDSMLEELHTHVAAHRIAFPLDHARHRPIAVHVSIADRAPGILVVDGVAPLDVPSLRNVDRLIRLRAAGGDLSRDSEWAAVDPDSYAPTTTFSGLVGGEFDYAIVALITSRIPFEAGDCAGLACAIRDLSGSSLPVLTVGWDANDPDRMRYV